MALSIDQRGMDKPKVAGRSLLKVPNFIIVGAMKSGTTSMHAALGVHPGVYMPEGEVQLFSVDDIEQNTVFFSKVDGSWSYQDFEAFFGEYVAWHAGLYKDAPDGVVLGEDAPSYLPSKRAIDRIATYAPDAKLIVMLRDPVARLYSHYWHWVRTYRAIYDLEDTIRFQHGNLLQRSYYEEQLRYCLSRIPEEQVHVVIFEEFVRDQDRIMAEVFAFLGLGPYSVQSSGRQHANPGLYPRYPRLALWRNRFFRELYGQRYRGRVPRVPEGSSLSAPKRMLLHLHRLVNPDELRRPEPMDDGTRRFLTALLRERNAGLPDLLKRDLAAYWPTFRSSN